jgi:hypothetical protein
MSVSAGLLGKMTLFFTNMKYHNDDGLHNITSFSLCHGLREGFFLSQYFADI